MIKISTFYLFDNLRRITSEFHEDKVKVTLKTFTYEETREFNYEEISEISDAFNTNGAQASFGFWLLCFSAFTLAAFCNFIYSHPVLLQLERAIYLGSVILYFAGLKKTRHIYFRDNNDHLVTAIKQTRQNHELIKQAIQHVKLKTRKVRELSVATPFPEEKFEFEHIEHNIPSLEKTIDRFYEDKIIGFEKGVFGERIYQINFDQLSGKIYRSKLKNSVSGSILTLATLLITIHGGFYFAFALPLGMTVPVYFPYLAYTLLAFFLISLLFDLTKYEVIGFFDRTGNIEYWTRINRSNKVNFQRITEFVLSKVSTDRNQQILKEEE